MKSPYNPEDLTDTPNKGVTLQGWLIAFAFAMLFWVPVLYLIFK